MEFCVECTEPKEALVVVVLDWSVGLGLPELPECVIWGFLAVLAEAVVQSYPPWFFLLVGVGHLVDQLRHSLRQVVVDRRPLECWEP